MRRYLLDTGSAADCIERRRGVHERVKQARAAGGKIGIGMPVLAELLAGIEYSASRERNLDIVNRNLRLFRLWPSRLTLPGSTAGCLPSCGGPAGRCRSWTC
jgi:predicted nucleic acid-binding protein